jgi:hypothetical protein
MLTALSLLIACSTPEPKLVQVVEEPKIVPVTPEYKANEMARLKSQPPDGRDVEGFSLLAANQFAGQEFTLIIAGTDSMSGGLDGWRTCAKLTPDMLGVPKDALVGMFDENMQACAQHPDGYVTVISVAVPGSTAPTLTSPSYKTEQMTVMVGMAVTANNPQ